MLLALLSGFLSIAVSQITLGLALFCLLYRLLVPRESLPVTGLEKTAAALALWALITIPFSTNIPQSVLFYRRFYLFSAIWIAASLASRDDRRQALLWFLLAGAFIASVGGQVIHLIQHGQLFKARMGEVFNAMTGAALLMMASLVASGFVVAPGQRKRNFRLAVAVVALPTFLGLIMTLTRGALIGLVAGLASILLLVRPRLFLGLLICIAILVPALLQFGEGILPQSIWERLDPQYMLHGGSTMRRLDMWQGGWAMIKANPVVGVGDRGIAEIAPQYYTSSRGEYWGHLHSNIVQMAVIWGIPGLLLGQAFLWAGLWFLWKRWRTLRICPSTGQDCYVRSGWVLGAIGAWVGFYVAGLTEWYFGDAESMLIYLAIMGCALGPDPRPQEE